jgi:outer membrane protein
MNKKISLFIIAACINIGAFAQFNKGRMLVGGSLGFSMTSSKDPDGGGVNEKDTYFSLAPQLGWFVVNRLAVGANVDLSFYKTTSEANGQSSSTSGTGVQVEPFIRYYLQPGIFFQGQVGAGTVKYKSSGDVFNPVDGTFNITSWALSAGYAYFLNDHVAIEPILGYSSQVYHMDTQFTNSGLSLRIGLQLYLGKK